MVAATRTKSSAERPRSGPTSTSAGATVTPASITCGWISRLVVTVRSSETPAASGSTSARTTPFSARAGTMILLATCAWGTANSVPSSSHPPSGTAVACTGGTEVGLETTPFSAAVRTTSPATTPGSHMARWASDPKCAMGSAPNTRVAHNGTGATALPCASRRRHSSMSP